jgi:hypothetical protein
MGTEEKMPKRVESQELAKITNNQFLKDYSIPAINRKYRSINSVSQAIDLNTPSLAKINKHFGEDFILAYIEGWIVNLRKFLNVGKSMTDNQTEETAIFILSEYYSITIADIYLVFKKAKLGHFGKIYDRLDGQVILSWFDEFFKERCNVCAERSVNEADKYKDDPYVRHSTKYKSKERLVKIDVMKDKYNE